MSVGLALEDPSPSSDPAASDRCLPSHVQDQTEPEGEAHGCQVVTVLDHVLVPGLQGTHRLIDVAHEVGSGRQGEGVLRAEVAHAAQPVHCQRPVTALVGFPSLQQLVDGLVSLGTHTQPPAQRDYASDHLRRESQRPA